MTYCIGWKSATAAFLVADSAFTSYRPPVFGRKSSVGELHPQIPGDPLGPRMHVQEGAMKVFRIRNSIATFSGDKESGYAVLRRLRAAFELTDDPHVALERAVLEGSAASAAANIRVLVASCADGQPRLISFNRAGDRAVVEEDGIIQIGTAIDEHRIRTADAIKSYASLRRPSGTSGVTPDRVQLAMVIAQAQSYGTHHLVLDHGYGGAFSGAYVDGTGVHWQPDMLFEFHDATEDVSFVPGLLGLMASSVREEHLALVTTEGRYKVRIIVSPFNGPLDGPEHAGRLMEQVRNEFNTGRFDFIAFLSTAREDATVVDMNKNLEHRVLSVRLPGPENALNLGMGFTIRPELAHVICTPCPIAKLVSYIPPDVS